MSTGVLRIVSYNVDGLCDVAVQGRAAAAVAALVALSPAPDVVMLQEVTAENEGAFEDYARKRGMRMFSGAAASAGYFCCILLAPSFSSVKAAAEPFSGSVMGRHLVKISAAHPRFGVVSFLTSHLESCKEHGEERKRQFRQCLGDVVAAASGSTPRIAFFAGDTNLREAEVGKLPDGVADAWVLAGKPAAANYTWDLAANQNVSLPGGATPRMRLDRAYFCAPGPCRSQWSAVGFSLVGTTAKRYPGAPRPFFPSDHFGICIDLAFSGPPSAASAVSGGGASAAATAHSSGVAPALGVSSLSGALGGCSGSAVASAGAGSSGGVSASMGAGSASASHLRQTRHPADEEEVVVIDD